MKMLKMALVGQAKLRVAAGRPIANRLQDAILPHKTGIDK